EVSFLKATLIVHLTHAAFDPAVPAPSQAAQSTLNSGSRSIMCFLQPAIIRGRTNPLILLCGRRMKDGNFVIHHSLHRLHSFSRSQNGSWASSISEIVGLSR